MGGCLGVSTLFNSVGNSSCVYWCGLDCLIVYICVVWWLLVCVFWLFWFCRFACLGWLIVMVGIVGLARGFVVAAMFWCCNSLGILCDRFVACLCVSF